MDGDLKSRTHSLQHIVCLFILLVPFFQGKAYSESRLDLFERGVLSLQKGNLKAAEANFRAVLKEEPDNPFAYFNLGAIFVATRRIDLALTALNRAAELKPDLVAAHLRLAEIYEGQGNLPEAIREYEEAYLYLADESTPEGRTILGRLENLQNIVEVREKFERGIALLRSGKYVQSGEMFRDILSTQPQNAQAYNFLGIVLGIQNRFDEAIESFKESLHIKPDLTDSRIRLAELYQIRGELKDARLELERAIFFLDDRDGAEAQSLEEKLNAIEDQIEIKSLMDRSTEEIEEKKSDAAIATLEEMTRLYPKNAVAYFNLGNLLAQKNRFDRAEVNFKKAIEFEPNYTEAYQRLGQLYEFIRFFSRAKDQYEKALATGGRTAVMQQELKASIGRTERGIQQAKLAGQEALRQSNEALEQGDLNKGTAFLEQVVFLDPENPEFHFRLGELYERTDKIDPAFNEMRAALEFAPGLAAAHQHIGLFYEKRGYFYQALKEWKEAESSAPSDRNKAEIERLETKILEIKKETAPLRERARQEADEGKKILAIETLKKAVTLSPDDMNLRMELGQLYSSVGSTTDAFSELNFGLLLDPGNGEAHYRLGMLYSSAGQWRDARVKHQDALQSRNLSTELRLKAASELARAENKIKNEQIAARYFNRGNRYLSAQDYRGAIEAFERVLSFYPNAVGSLYWLGTAYEGLNNPDEATRYYKKVLALNPNHILARQQLGFVYETQGQNERAIQIYQRTLDLLSGQESPEGAWIKGRLQPLEKRYSININQVALSYESNPFQTSDSSSSTLLSNLNLTLTYYLKKDRRLSIPIELSTQNTMYFKLNSLFSRETFSIKLNSLQSPFFYSLGYSANFGISDSGGVTSLDQVGSLGLERSINDSTSIGLDYVYDNFYSYRKESDDAVRQNIRLSSTYRWNMNSLNLSYSFSDNAYRLSDQAYRSHGIGLSHSRQFTESLRGSISYSAEWKRFSNPDSFNTFFLLRPVFRENFLHSLSLSALYFFESNFSLGLSYTEIRNDSNLPVAPFNVVTPEERLSGQFESLGDYRQRVISMTLNWSF